METLHSKKAVLLAPKFFGYETEIQKELEKLGVSVTYFDERPENTFFTKAVLRLNLPFLIRKRISNYYKIIFQDSTRHTYDYIILINPETIDENILEQLKKCNPNAKTIVYFWDSIANKKNALKLLPLADRFFSFDPNDSKNHSRIEFLPLFYISDYGKLANSESKSFKYDISFIGTIHSDRYSIVKKIETYANGKGLRTFLFFFCPSKGLFWWKKLVSGEFKNIKYSDVSFTPISKENALDIIRHSKAVIDIEHPKQTGLTMRTIEMLGARKKLLTTNAKIKEYDFFDKHNVFIVDRKVSSIPFRAEDIDRPYQDPKQHTYNKYALSSWVKTILGV